MTRLKTALWIAVVTAGVMLSAGTVRAETILIDLGNDQSFRGASVVNPDPNGNFWNSVWAGAFYVDLLDQSGNSTAVDFGFSADGGNDSFNGPAGTSTDPADAIYNAAALGNLGVNEAVFDYYVSSRFEIQGLDPGKTYDLTFFGSHKFNSDDVTRYTIYTDNTYTSSVASADLLVGSGPNHNEDTVVTISGVAPQTGNILYIGFAGANGGSGYLNALQIDAVPEPTGSVMLVTACLGMLSWTRPRAVRGEMRRQANLSKANLSKANL